MKASDIASALAGRICDLAMDLLGKPTARSAHEWRYGKKGSIAIVVIGQKSGSCFNHERGEGGDALWLVQQCKGGSVRDAMDWSLDWLGISGAAPSPIARPVKRVPEEKDDRSRIEHAMRLWCESLTFHGTVVETYLRTRCALPDIDLEDIRFHPLCPMGEEKLPVMIALLRNTLTDEPQAVHRTALLSDGSGKHAAGKKMLGPKAGTAIKLCPAADVSIGLGISEGIENALSAMAAGWSPMWAAGDAGGISSFPIVPGVEHLTIFADADDSGVGVFAARSCAARWQAAGLAVTIHLPPAGKDWNDIARERTA